MGSDRRDGARAGSGSGTKVPEDRSPCPSHCSRHGPASAAHILLGWAPGAGAKAQQGEHRDAQAGSKPSDTKSRGFAPPGARLAPKPLRRGFPKWLRPLLKKETTAKSSEGIFTRYQSSPTFKVCGYWHFVLAESILTS